MTFVAHINSMPKCDDSNIPHHPRGDRDAYVSWALTNRLQGWVHLDSGQSHVAGTVLAGVDDTLGIMLILNRHATDYSPTQPTYGRLEEINKVGVPRKA